MDGGTGKAVKLFFDDRQTAHRRCANCTMGNGAVRRKMERRARSSLPLPTGSRSAISASALLAVHDADYLAFLERAHHDWLAAGAPAMPSAIPGSAAGGWRSGGSMPNLARIVTTRERRSRLEPGNPPIGRRRRH
jgi:acetoin utilization deacetylase AcuC-like enzyme